MYTFCIWQVVSRNELPVNDGVCKVDIWKQGKEDMPKEDILAFHVTQMYTHTHN